MGISTWFLAFAFLFSRILCQDTENYFINPPPGGPIHDYSQNNVYATGSLIRFQWQTNYTTMSLVLWQNDNSSFQYFIQDQPASLSYTWTVDLSGKFSLDQGDVFFLGIFNEDGSEAQFGSHYFNITDSSAQATPTTMTTSVSATSIPTSVTAATDISTTSTSSPTSSSTAAVSSGGLSSSAQVGIGVGVGVGVGALLVGLAIGYFVRRKRNVQQPYQQAPMAEVGGKEQPFPPSPAPAMHSPYDNEASGGYQAYQPQPGGWDTKGAQDVASQQQASELPANQEPQELMGRHK
ncbi:hypothetical protein HII31_04961 [Pseudocercospora fuligena]|uniref:Mid2 domain-containing protein n=1 Tax=Pseudocercospora fuligena TaxID=685502 RepID=A0A8H6RJQ5_9PEZI|nr:hypothetical protein HII31_04961 [Pseudocercospora fuligena]